MKILIFLFVFSSTAFAQLFTESNSGVTVDLNSVSFSSSFPVATTWIAGDSGTILKSTTGSAWANVRSNPIPSNLTLNSVCSFDINSVIVTGNSVDSSFVFMSSNSGLNWSLVLSQNNGFFYSIGKTSTSNGVLIGKPVNGRWSIWKTTNKGASWDSTNLYLPQSGNETSISNSLYCNPMEADLWFGTNNSKIYRLQNYSIMTSQQISELNSYATTFYGGMGWTGGNSLLRTTNFGNNWVNPVSNPPGSSDISTLYNGPIGIFVTRLDNKIYRSTNNGASWNLVYTATTGYYRHSSYYSLFGGGLIFVRSNGGITICGFPDGLNLVSSIVPDKFSLSQNYPNPFNPTTNFEFRIAEFGFVNLTIFDIMGREVESLVNGNLKPGTYKADWNASIYPSGLYFYRISAGNFTETRKMMLVK